jgi:hypothetical protein
MKTEDKVNPQVAMRNSGKTNKQIWNSRNSGGQRQQQDLITEKFSA